MIGLGYNCDKTLGINVHSCLLITPDGVTTGLVDQSTNTRKTNSDPRSLHEKQKRKIQELSQIIGLPTAIAKLPVALGKVPASQMQLGSKHTKKTETQEPKESSFDKKEPETGAQMQESNNNSGLPLPSSCCLSGGLEDEADL